MTKTDYCWGVAVFLGLILTPALAQELSDYADPESPGLFSAVLWWTVLGAGLCGLGCFYLWHKHFWKWDFFWPYYLALTLAGLLVVLPPYFNNNLYGWFGRDCFQDYIVSSDRVVAEGSRPNECVDARENIEALGIAWFIRKYQDGILDSSPLTTTEIEIVYGFFIAVWTAFITLVFVVLYKMTRIK